MRIISKDEVERKHKCPVCKSVIAYKLKDTYLSLWDERKFICPECKESVKVSIFDKKLKLKE